MKKRHEFIVELDKLKKQPCAEYLKYFKDGKVDALKVFKKLGYRYFWLYQNSEYDLIEYEVREGIFSWRKHLGFLIHFRPHLINPDKLSKKQWLLHGHIIAQFKPEAVADKRFNWKYHSRAVAIHCPDMIDPKKFNWEKDSDVVAKYCPHKIDPKRFNWERFTWAVEDYCPEYLYLIP